MSDILAIVPYYGGGDENINCMLRSPIVERHIYVLKTCLNLLEFCKRVIVAVATESDERHLRGISSRIEVKRFNNYPFHLPAKIVNTIKWGNDPEKYILYTEADHLFHVRDISPILDACDGKHYVMPQRLDEVGPDGSHWLQEADVVDIDGRRYAINNRFASDLDAPVVKEMFYAPSSRFTSYAGAYILRRDTLKYVDFPYDFFGLIVERVSGFNLFHADGLVPLKPRVLTDFWIEHLSGHYQNKMVAEGKVAMEAIPDLRDGE